MRMQTINLREPLCKFEHEPEGDEGQLETLVTLGAIVSTYLSGFGNGAQNMAAFLIFGTLGLLMWGWLFKLSIPEDDDKGL